MKKRPTHIIYIPGLGDGYDPFRQRLLKLWHYKNVSVELVPMRWLSDEPYEAKIARIEAAIDLAKGKRIVLVGESAGGSVVVALYAKWPANLHKVMTVCGKNTRPGSVSPYLYARNPAFRQSMQQAEKGEHSLTNKQKRQFISIHPLYDPTVPVQETLLPGCRELTLWSVGHLVPIIQALTFSSWRLIHIAREDDD